MTRRSTLFAVFVLGMLAVLGSLWLSIAHRTSRVMAGMGGIMMWGVGLLWLLAIIVLVLAAAALVKYLRSGETK